MTIQNVHQEGDVADYDVMFFRNDGRPLRATVTGHDRTRGWVPLVEHALARLDDLESPI